MKRSLLLLGLLILLEAAALALDTSCPVKITDVRNIAGTVRLLFRNTSRLEIIEYEFVVWFVDSDKQVHFLPVLAQDPATLPVTAGASAVVVYPAPEMLQYTFSVANAYLLRATFTGGTAWNDDGSHACKLAALQE